MNRLARKCFVASAGVHLLLLAILLVGPAFLTSKAPGPESFPVIEFVPIMTTDLPTSGGGSPSGAPPLPQPTPPAPLPKPEIKPTPVPPAPREVRPAPAPPPTERARSTEPDVTDTKPKKRLPEVSTEVVTRKPDPKANRRTPSDDAEDTRAADARTRAREVAREFASAAGALRKGLSGSTSVELLGPGGGGIPYANFKQSVFSVYYNAWEPPARIANENAIAKASVTIDRDGTVINFQITAPSGDADMDASVRRTLERVKYAAPLPEGSKESQRTVTIVFDLKAKRGIE
jgi:TonB family protein